MEQESIDIYIVPSDDFHQSEYVGNILRPASLSRDLRDQQGPLVITKNMAGLWTDGRYFIQAEKELAGSGITLFKSGEPGVDTIEQFLEKELPSMGVIGFDGRTVGVNTGKRYAQIAAEKHGSVSYHSDLIGRIWNDRPQLPMGKAFLLGEKYSGEKHHIQITESTRRNEKVSANIHLLSSLDDIAWLLNIRGSDIAYCPLVLSYMMVYEDHAELYADERNSRKKVLNELKKNEIFMKPYNDIYAAVKNINPTSVILLDPERINYTLYQNIPEEAKIIERENPEVLMKCIKNDTEINNNKKGASQRRSRAHKVYVLAETCVWIG